MKLTTRISAFFLATLAVVLIGLSASIYWLARLHLTSQLDQQSIDALDALTIAAEQTPDGVEWDVSDRRLSFSQTGGVPPAWGVFDAVGKKIDGPWPHDFPAPSVSEPTKEEQHPQPFTWKGENWEITRRLIKSQVVAGAIARQRPLADDEPTVRRFASIIIAVAVPVDAATAPLEYLGIILAISSVLVWFAVAAGGRWLGKKALAPMTRMAETARSISAADLSQRLPSPRTSDELEELARSFNDLLNRLQISFEQQQRFAAEASHQLRTPLTSIIGEIDVALRRERDVPEYRRILELARGQAARLSQIVDMLLFLTRETAEASPPELEKVDLAAWMGEHLRQWERHSRFADIRFEFDGIGEYPVMVNSSLLAQAVDNLLDNACKYSHVGAPVTIHIARSDGLIRLTFADRGYGIAADDLPEIYNPFFRSVEARRRGIRGVGLGLTIVRRIVSAFKGRLEVESRLGEGSSFSLVFPEVQPEEGRAAAVEHVETAVTL